MPFADDAFVQKLKEYFRENLNACYFDLQMQAVWLWEIAPGVVAVWVVHTNDDLFIAVFDPSRWAASDAFVDEPRDDEFLGTLAGTDHIDTRSSTEPPRTIEDFFPFVKKSLSSTTVSWLPQPVAIWDSGGI